MLREKKKYKQIKYDNKVDRITSEKRAKTICQINH